MTDRSMDELLAAAAPIGDDELTALSLDGLDHQMRKAIMSTPAVAAIEQTAGPSTPPRRGRLWRRVIAVAAAAALVGAAVAVSPLGRSRDSAWATEVLAVAESSPRLLVDLPGWEVTRADEFTVDLGEMTFSDGRRDLDLHWRPASTHDGYVSDRAASSEPPRQITVNGQPATEFQYLGTTDFTTLWLGGGHSFEARGSFADRASYEAVIAALTPTDIDTWLNAMPESVVKPDNRATVIAAMLEDIPQPSNFDVTELGAATNVSDRYQLGSRVSGAVACQWIEQWLSARTVGDMAAESEALDAMQTARNWSILLEMARSGAYPQVLWEYADAMAGRGAFAEPGITIEESYSDALGCAPES